MRSPARTTLFRSTAVRIALPVLLLLGTGCSTLRSTIAAYEVGPNGIARPQLRLREALAHADFSRALEWKEDDALLRALTVGASSYYASQFARSAAVLDSAALLADDRITKSLSKEGLALLTNDNARPYQVRRIERLFIPYYAMLSYARLEQWEDAAVEARRLSALLQQYAAERTDSERRTHAVLHYLAGSVFDRAGELEEAVVSHRLARAAAPEIVDSTRSESGVGEGEVLLVVERGFIAHRATESLNLFLGDADTLRGRWSRRREHGSDDDDKGYWLSVAFPALRRAPYVRDDATILIDDCVAIGSRVDAVVDDAARADEQRERAALIARATTRAVAKYALTKAVKDKKGEVAGQIANIGASLLERADVRSWHLLPQSVTLMRVRATAGEHRIRINAGGAEHDLGPVAVKAGETSIVTVRVWGEPSGTRRRR